MTFEDYLISKGYSKTTPKGKPSTVYDYQNRVHVILDRERAGTRAGDITYIRDLVKLYDNGGAKEEYGQKSHRANINALKQYLAFLESTK